VLRGGQTQGGGEAEVIEGRHQLSYGALQGLPSFFQAVRYF
jgi:hypothetical protein